MADVGIADSDLNGESFIVRDGKEESDEDASSSDDEGKLIITEEVENDNALKMVLKEGPKSRQHEGSENVKLYSCYHCSRKFTSYRALDSHIKLTPLEELEISLQKNALRVLQNCNLVVAVPDLKDKEPPEKAKPKPVTKTMMHPCPMCDYTSPRMNQLRSHMLIIHTDVRPCKCPLCDYSCINNSKLKLHMIAKHTHEKPHQCQLCNYKGTRSSHLKRHIEKYHNEESMFKCPHCNFKGVSAFYLKKHMKSEHDVKY